MMGTTFSVKAAMRPMPPKNTNAASAEMITPMSSGGREKAVWKASAMELDWTMLPMNPSAMMMEMEKKAASFLLPRPFEM
jgi:hypothetical protein